jgi:CRP-like cAMP-binding protein
MTNILSRVEVFDGLTKDELKIISKHCQKMHFDKGDILVKAGQKSSALYIIIEGQLKVFLPKQIEGTKEHRVSEVNLNVLNEGDCFGEYSLIENMPTSASVVGVRPGKVLKIEDDAFDRLMDDDHIAKTVYKNLLRILIRRLRKKDKEFDLLLVVDE